MTRSRSRSPCRTGCSPTPAAHLGADEGVKPYDAQGPAPNVEQRSTLDFAALSVDVLDQSDWVEKAARVFKRYRVVILTGLFSKSVTDLVWRSLQELHKRWSATYDSERVGNRLAGRYDLGSAYSTHHLTHLPGFLDALEDFASAGGLRLLSQLGGYKFVGGQGTLCLAHTENWQPLHADIRTPWLRELHPMWKWPRHVPCIDLMFTVHPLTSLNGPMRIVPGQPESCWQRERPPRLEDESEESKRSQLYPLPAGCGIMRDVRVWHGGVPNASDEDRYIPVLQFYSDWCLELCGSRTTEGPGVDRENMESKLSPETQGAVAEHIVRRKGDEEPQLNGKTARWFGQFY